LNLLRNKILILQKDGCHLNWGDLNELFSYLIAFGAAIAAGGINALAGGGTLITFPVLTALGLPAVIANVTNTVALCPGYIGGVLSQRKDLDGKAAELWIYLPVSFAGGIIGGLLLLHSGEKLFSGLVPYLILFATILLALQGQIRQKIKKRSITFSGAGYGLLFGSLFLIPAAVYGGYFGAGVSVIVLAVLGLFSTDSLTRLNALKQAIAFSINIAAAVFFIFSGMVNWTFASIMAIGALAGGVIGGNLAGKLQPGLLRLIVVSTGLLVSIFYFLR
jgi:uncharacterized protein